jgi:hypothetical protein
MVKKILLVLFVTMFCCVPAIAGTIAEEHEKAKKGGYEKEYEQQMEIDDFLKTVILNSNGENSVCLLDVEYI